MNIFKRIVNRIRVKNWVRKSLKDLDEFPDFFEWQKMSEEERTRLLQEKGWKDYSHNKTFKGGSLSSLCDYRKCNFVIGIKMLQEIK